VSFPYKLLAVLAAIAFMVIASFRAGVHHADLEWQAKQAEAERQANEKYRAEVARGDRAEAAYVKDHRDQEDRYEALDTQFKAYRKRRIPLVGPVVVPAARDASSPAGETLALRPADTTRRIQLSDAQLQLRMGAVWMWNSALAGRDVPAGACNAAAAAGAAEAACAENSGIGLDEAWDNQADNARSCARDRQRLQHLIDFLQQKGVPK
jgi:hypothetical protein